ncbi:hypothetical protein BX661DRAFT_178489 [Kickxella alabastrina]|uniref:uncharacterized protein n=1 Tax=Kickxella alabastrina TaxID=61397 RepID=UPI0022208273|nr:uncharacterized protein BX661DRAFT_178489 [Kickxella alabastrina]KAI7833493.1 hypothetical protein BX661DRAFT_178489 [Kickxella alabastrina]
MSYYNNQDNYNQGYPQQQGGYNQGYDQGYQQQQGGYNQGYDQGYQQQQGGYNQGYQQGGRTGDANPFDFDENMSVEDITRQLSGGSIDPAALSNVHVNQNSARDLEGFDMAGFEEFQNLVGQDGEFNEEGSRGMFGFGGGNAGGKSKTSHQLLGGAAAWAALNWYQTKAQNEGKKVNHGFIKKLLVAFAATQAVKYFEKSSHNFQSGVSRDLAIEQATKDASMIADIKFPDYGTHTYKAVAGGEASGFDSFNPGNQSGYQQGGYQQGGYQQGGYGGY